VDEELKKAASASPGPLRLGATSDIAPTGLTNTCLDLGIELVIPSKENEDRAVRPVEFDREAYRRRNIVERLIGWPKESRRIFSRYEKTAKTFGGMITVAFIRQYLTYKLVQSL
jgi:hypothetical protein